MYISNIDWTKYFQPILVLLYKRQYPNETVFGDWAQRISNESYKCKICKQIIFCVNLTMSQSLAEHGYFHLKEHSLLPFI